MFKFQIGDRVRCIKSSQWTKVGAMGWIQMLDYDGMCDVVWTIGEYEGSPNFEGWWVFEDEIKFLCRFKNKAKCKHCKSRLRCVTS